MFVIRPATKDDCSAIARLMRELAKAQNSLDQLETNEEGIREDGFCEKPLFFCFVAEVEDKVKEIVGYAIYFYPYSSWKGRSIYMEDLYVSPQYRHQGIGLALWKKVAEEGVKNKCKRLDFAVLDWNASAIKFYESKGAINVTKSSGLNVFRLDELSLKTFIS